MTDTRKELPIDETLINISEDLYRIGIKAGQDYQSQQSRIDQLEQQLAEAQYALKVKDELIYECIEENGHLADGDDCTLRHIVKALAIQPSTEHLEAYLRSKIESVGFVTSTPNIYGGTLKSGLTNDTPLYALKEE